MAAAMEKGVLLSKTSPAFLHANSTSHTWTFSAIAELIDNAYDPDVNATLLMIDKSRINEKQCLTFTDNGNGLDPQKLHRMLSFGYCDKIEINGHKPVGHYGNGFKSGSMRLGRDAIVFTKQKMTMSCGFLSQTFLERCGADTVLVPIVTWEASTRKRLRTPDSDGSLQAIIDHSIFRSEKELLREFNALLSFKHGTRIIVYNLKRGSDQKLELDIESNPFDIINSEHMELDFTGYRPVKEHTPEYRRSLRDYCSILYLKPKMKIMICGKKVRTKLVSKSLSNTEKDYYRPAWLNHHVKIIFGFTPEDRKEEYGVLMYHRNRLIKAYEKVGYQKQANDLGVGVVGVVEVDFLEPIHNKQDFNKTDRYNACMNALTSKLNDYWNEKKSTPGTSTQIVSKPDWLWAQCENEHCLKWRRMPDGIDNDRLPDKWYCFMNPDPMHNRCDIDEEPEDEDEIMAPTYQKTFKKKKEIEKRKQEMRRAQEAEELARKEKLLKAKEKQLKQKEVDLILREPLAEEPSAGADRKPTIADLAEAHRELETVRMESQKKEKEMNKLIVKLKLKTKQTGSSDFSTAKINTKTVQKLMDMEQGCASTSGAGKRPGEMVVGENGKRQRIEAEGEDFVITMDVEEEEVIVIEDDDDPADSNDTSPTPQVDKKPSKQELDHSMQIHKEQPEKSSLTNGANCIKTEKTSEKEPPSKEKCPTTTSLPSTSTASQTERRIQRTVETQTPAKNESNATEQKLKDTEKKLRVLREHVSQLMTVIVPEVDLGEVEFIDDIVVQLIEANSQ